MGYTHGRHSTRDKLMRDERGLYLKSFSLVYNWKIPLFVPIGLTFTNLHIYDRSRESSKHGNKAIRPGESITTLLQP